MPFSRRAVPARLSSLQGHRCPPSEHPGLAVRGQFLTPPCCGHRGGIGLQAGAGESPEKDMAAWPGTGTMLSLSFLLCSFCIKVLQHFAIRSPACAVASPAGANHSATLSVPALSPTSQQGGTDLRELPELGGTLRRTPDMHPLPPAPQLLPYPGPSTHHGHWKGTQPEAPSAGHHAPHTSVSRNPVESPGAPVLHGWGSVCRPPARERPTEAGAGLSTGSYHSTGLSGLSQLPPPGAGGVALIFED